MAQDPSVGREMLPIPDRVKPGLTVFDAKDPANSFPPIEPLRPDAGAPNVVVVLLDDVGFGAASAFGGPCPTPTAERLARGGLMYNRFHTTALCSPTRMALLTGRNHHSVGFGSITELATSGVREFLEDFVRNLDPSDQGEVRRAAEDAIPRIGQ